MDTKEPSLPRDSAGNFLGGPLAAAGAFSNTGAPDAGCAHPGHKATTHEEAGGLTLPQARAVLAFVVEHTDAEIAAACCVLRDSPDTDERDRSDACEMLRHLTGMEAANA